jgi:hypothetical protein
VKKFSLVLIVILGFLSLAPADRYTWVALTEAETGRKVFSAVLRDGEQAVLTWRNSLFGLDVTEVFQAGQGMLILDQVTFADPRGLPPPVVAPVDVEDLYHTGGPFTAGGIGKSFSRVVYRVGEIGNPKMTIRDRTVIFTQEVGFGGGLILTAAPPTWLEVLLDCWRAIS